MKQDFINEQVQHSQKAFEKAGLDFEIFDDDIKEYLKHLSIAALVIDFNPILDRRWLKDIECMIYEVDGHNIVPARFVSDKQEYSAATLRRKIYRNIYPFLTEYKQIIEYTSSADLVLKNFVKNKLPYYAELKNNPCENVLSELSKYLNLGFISSQRVAIEVIQSEVSDISYIILISSLLKQGVHIKTIPKVNSINLIVDDSNALIVSDGSNVQYGALYSDRNGVSQIRSTFDKIWAFANDLDENVILSYLNKEGV